MATVAVRAAKEEKAAKEAVARVAKVREVVVRLHLASLLSSLHGESVKVLESEAPEVADDLAVVGVILVEVGPHLDVPPSLGQEFLERGLLPASGDWQVESIIVSL